MRDLFIIMMICLCGFAYCSVEKEDNGRYKLSDSILHQDSLFRAATWYIYSLNCNESSRLVNLTNSEGEVWREQVPIVTVPFKINAIDERDDTITYTYSLREYMSPAGNYNALFYEITFVADSLHSAKDDGNFVADLRGADQELGQNSLLLSEIKMNKTSLADFIRNEAQKRGIIK